MILIIKNTQIISTIKRQTQKIRENIESTIKKWEKAKKDIINRKHINYRYKYWTKEGYCNIFNCRPTANNNNCPLRISKPKRFNVVYCCGHLSQPPISIVAKAITYANLKNWDEALECVNILISKMKRDKDSFTVRREEGLLI